MVLRRQNFLLKPKNVNRDDPKIFSSSPLFRKKNLKLKWNKNVKKWQLQKGMDHLLFCWRKKKFAASQEKRITQSLPVSQCITKLFNSRLFLEALLTFSCIFQQWNTTFYCIQNVALDYEIYNTISTNFCGTLGIR